MSALNGGIMLYREEAVRAEARKLRSMGTDAYLLELVLHNFNSDYYERVDLLKNVIKHNGL